jgi:hypothetical protein
MPNSARRKPGFLFWTALGAMLLQTSLAPLPSPAKTAPASSGPRASATPRRPAPAEPNARRAAPRSLALSDIHVRRELPIVQWLRPGEYAWDDDGAPDGPVVIVANIRARVLSVYRGGYEIGRSSIIYGAGDKPTPFGTFPILQKDADHRSSLYGGAPMPHMLRLTGDGISIHGSEIADDYATHGCIGLPRKFAALLFAAAHVGDSVLIWKGDRLTEGSEGGEGGRQS